MKHSIRLRLFVAVSGLILFYMFSTWFMNRILLERYYFHNEYDMLKQSLNLINGLYKGDINEDMQLVLEKLEHSRGLNIIIQDGNFNTIYDSMPRRQVQRPRLPAQPVPDNRVFQDNRIKVKVPDLSRKNFLIENKLDARLGLNFISLYARLNNGDYILFTTSVAAIKESAVIANRFFIFTGLITLICGMVIVFFLSKRFTRPILELKAIAGKMSSLDFESRYLGRTDDELGELGQSINSLSEQLQKSIRELKTANAKLQADIEKERKIDEMRKYFLSSISHELKTPIALIQGYAEGLKINVNEDEENKNFYCDVIMDESFKMNKLVRQILELSQLESGEIELDRTDFHISSLLSQVLKKNELIFKNNGIKMSAVEEKDYYVNADYDKAEQVLDNYINNAMNHAEPPKELKIFIRRADGCARVAVFNTGRHIPDESMEKIWDSFYKVDKARTRAYGGSGLGLSIVRAIQEAHGRRYGASNVEGGVEFWFDLALTGEEIDADL